jgi:AcrR family transcriptional regulator
MMRVMASSSLREQNALAARERILSAVAELIERADPGELTMPAVAEASGISLRTVYRYYPTREELLEAAGRWIGDELYKHPYPRDLDEVADLYDEGCHDFDERPGLARALALSQLGQRARGYRRRERVEAIRRALRDELPGLTEEELRQAEAVLSYLHNILAYTSLREEHGLSGEEIGQAVGWAIRTLTEDLRKRNSNYRRKK